MGKRKRRTQEDCVSGATCSRSQQDDTAPKKRKKRPVKSSGKPAKAHTGPCYIKTLPGELLACIFEYLELEDKGRVARVCRQWRSLVSHPSLWRGVNAKLHVNRAKDAVFDSLQARGIKQVTVLDMCRPDRLQQLLATLSDMETLSIEDDLLTNQELKSIFSDCTLLHLTYLHLRCKNLDSTSISFALERLDNVQRLEFQAFCQSQFFSILSVMMKVQHLTVTFESEGPLVAPQVRVPMPCMTELVLRKAWVDDSVFLHLKQAFPNLEKLDVDLHCDVTDEGIQHLAEMTQLRRLHLHSWDCPAAWMACLRDGLTELQVFEINALTLDFDSLMTLTELSSLKDLSVKTCHLTWGECKRLVEACGNLTRFALWLRGVPPEFNPPPGSLCPLPHLEEVRWTLGKGGDDDHIKALCSGLSSVEKLVLKPAHDLTDDSLKHVAQVQTLKSLVVSGNYETITGRGLQYLRKGRAPLRDLSLENLPKVGDTGIKELQGLESLQSLQVIGCGVSDKALRDCVMGLPRLQVLEANMSRKGKRQLRRMRPGLTVSIVSAPPFFH